MAYFFIQHYFVVLIFGVFRLQFSILRPGITKTKQHSNFDLELQKQNKTMVAIDDIQFGFMPRKGTIHAFFVLRRIREEFRGKEKMLCMCFVNLKKAFDRISIKVVEWALRKKKIAITTNIFAIVVGVVTKDAREGS